MKLKRLMMLALCLALVCGLCVTAFAESRFEIYEPYDNDQTFVDVSAMIDQYSTIGVIEVQTFIFDAVPDTRASVACTYYDANGNFCYGGDNAYNDYTSVVSVGFPAGTIREMIKATYNFWGEVPTTYGWQEFVIEDRTIVYSVT